MADNLEQKIDYGNLSLSDLAFQVAAFNYTKEGPVDPNIIEAAISRYVTSNKNNLLDKIILSNVLLKDHNLAKASGNYTLSNALSTYFQSMNQGYFYATDKNEIGGKFVESTFGDINKALSEMGYQGEKLAPEAMTVKEALEKGGKDVLKLSERLTEFAKYHLKLMAENLNAGSSIKAINEKYKQKEEKLKIEA